jgi:hypothetical protein
MNTLRPVVMAAALFAQNALAVSPFDYLPENALPDMTTPENAKSLAFATDLGHLKGILGKRTIDCDDLATTFNRLEDGRRDFIDSGATPDLSGQPEEAMPNLVRWLANWKNGGVYDQLRPTARQVLTGTCGATLEEQPAAEESAMQKLNMRIERAILQ